MSWYFTSLPIAKRFRRRSLREIRPNSVDTAPCWQRHSLNDRISEIKLRNAARDFWIPGAYKGLRAKVLFKLDEEVTRGRQFRAIGPRSRQREHPVVNFSHFMEWCV